MRFGHTFFFNDTATTEIYTRSLHDALPICWRASTSCPSWGRCCPTRRPCWTSTPTPEGGPPAAPSPAFPVHCGRSSTGDPRAIPAIPALSRGSPRPRAAAAARERQEQREGGAQRPGGGRRGATSARPGDDGTPGGRLERMDTAPHDDTTPGPGEGWSEDMELAPVHPGDRGRARSDAAAEGERLQKIGRASCRER